MSSGEKKTTVSLQEYFALEEKADSKSEFYNGEIFAMSGGTLNHALIATNFNGELRNSLAGKNCLVIGSDLLIRIEKADSNVYPDGMVICEEPEYFEDRKDIVKNPLVVIEVLSDSTAAWDRGGKFRKYQQLTSLKEYIIVEQETPQVDVFRINPDGFWVLEGYEGTEAVVQIKSLAVNIPLKGIYQNVSFP